MSSTHKMLNTSRKFTDICKLTPYEEKMWGFASQGMNKKQIAEAMGAKNVGSILPRLKIIKEKIESASY